MSASAAALLVVATLLGDAPATRPQPATLPVIPLIIARGERFVIAGTDQTFTPWGFNYDRTVLKGRDVLLAEALQSDPEKVSADFAAMRRMGGNVARVFVATADLLSGPEEVSPEGLQQLDLLLSLAERNGLRLILTGLANIEPAAAPAWLRELDDDVMERVEVLFWQTVARRCRDHGVIFAYDLQNEPVIHSRDRDEWTLGCFDMGGGRRFCYVHAHYRRISRRWTAHIQKQFGTPEALRQQWTDFPRPGESWENIALPEKAQDPRYGRYIMFHGSLLKTWAKRLKAAIRKEDPHHLITVGPLDPQVFADIVDFHCFHFYPQNPGAASQPAPPEDYLAHNARQWRRRVEALPKGKPVVIEEFYPMFLPAGVSMADTLKTLLDATRPRTAGWVSFYWGPAESLKWPLPGFDRIYTDWLELWSQARPE